jgi:hypothetical protein
MKASGILGLAGAVLLLTAGCDHLDQLHWNTSGNLGKAGAVADALLPALSFSVLARDGQIYYSASVDATSVSLQNVLRALGLTVSVTPEPNGGIRIASATPDGKRFFLLVQPGAPTSSGATQSKVVIEWENPADGQQGLVALTQLETSKKSSK